MIHERHRDHDQRLFVSFPVRLVRRQETDFDEAANVRAFGTCDEFMAMVLEYLPEAGNGGGGDVAEAKTKKKRGAGGVARRPSKRTKR